MSRKKKQRPRHKDVSLGKLNAQTVLRVFKDAQKPLSTKEVIGLLGLKNEQRDLVHHILENLVDAGKIMHLRGAYGLLESMRLVSGKLEVQRSGVGFVIPDDKRRKDIFINPRDFDEAWHGDHVVAAITRQRKNKSHEGRIVRVLERGETTYTCRVMKTFSHGFSLCRPTDPRLQINFMADLGDDIAMPDPGEIVVVEVGEQLEYQLFSSTIIEVIGREDDVEVQEKLVKVGHKIPTRFPEAALAQAASLPEVPDEGDFHGRTDLRDLPLVTIDGAKARDFDDAVYVKKTPHGYTLWVAIADVAHYVEQQSPLDREAYARGNSYYFPKSVEPMFPERLSNGLCSLNPDVPRLSMVAEMDFDDTGTIKGKRLYNAVIKSHARLTYAQVNRAVILKEEEERANLSHVLHLLETAEALARQLNARRIERGSLDFDLPEPEVLFGFYGETVDIRPRARTFAHQIIEEFMVAANEAVAEYLTERAAPILYRVHPNPDPLKLENLFQILTQSGIDVGKTTSPTAKDLQDILAKVDGTDKEFVVNRLTLRTMMQARYAPSNEGHYGLASKCYSHFTSPIRRYADLVLHRVLKAVLAGEHVPYTFNQLTQIGDHISKRERIAMDAEREILKRLTILFLQDKIGQTFTGVINSLADFGFWVELNEVMAEGMVRLSSLTDDYYAFFPERQEMLGERTGKRLHLGQSVRVMLEDVQIGRLEINLKLLGSLRSDGDTTEETSFEVLPRSKKKSKSRSKSKPSSYTGRSRSGRQTRHKR
ncbi:ribonuclease R [Desulfovibrio inopinatus]|uniref:ribonuclease R n=1 Tax=Desulfovibrio inopinatus TaxID=102109 RepID=UPI00040910AC|nr:ribonuclease R [Desulfovibrio inopinatus]